jgi:hypothetical protein
VNHDHDKTISLTQKGFFFTAKQAVPMTALAYALLGFVAGLFTMAIISLYRYVIKKASR